MEKVTSLTFRKRLVVFLKFIVRFQEMYAFMAPKWVILFSMTYMSIGTLFFWKSNHYGKAR